MFLPNNNHHYHQLTSNLYTNPKLSAFNVHNNTPNHWHISTHKKSLWTNTPDTYTPDEWTQGVGRVKQHEIVSNYRLVVVLFTATHCSSFVSQNPSRDDGDTEPPAHSDRLITR